MNAPPERGRRFAALQDLLVRAVLDWARRAGHAAVRLWVTTDNGPAQRATEGSVRSRPVLGGLHHVYKRVA